MCFQVAYESSNMIKCFLRVTTKCIRETSVPFLENQPQVLWGIYNETCRWWYVEPLYPPREEGRKGPCHGAEIGCESVTWNHRLFHKSIDTFAVAILFYCKFYYLRISCVSRHMVTFTPDLLPQIPLLTSICPNYVMSSSSSFFYLLNKEQVHLVLFICAWR